MEAIAGHGVNEGMMEKLFENRTGG